MVAALPNEARVPKVWQDGRNLGAGMQRRLLGGLILAQLISGTAAAQVAPPTAMIFFDWGKVEIQRDYAAALDKIAARARAEADVRLVVEGHSDRSGPSSASRQSSSRRAAAVRDHLIGRGVPADRIEVRAWGEERPLIATADGVREPQNRRVDVRLVASGSR
jgi:outer membrane protein OmpA-like peptidoglycan-associated protein